MHRSPPARFRQPADRFRTPPFGAFGVLGIRDSGFGIRDSGFGIRDSGIGNRYWSGGGCSSLRGLDAESWVAEDRGNPPTVVPANAGTQRLWRFVRASLDSRVRGNDVFGA
ncbi:hypothetical protein EYC45_12200 [Pseudoxanthomonas winnipegensis]|nr:hypothetical protein EYC45_12200 [Pseudoxanthomonas winnipegensis]